MQATTWPTQLGAVLANGLGIAAILLVLGVLTNTTTNLPWIGSDRGALIALVVVGFAMCPFGILAAEATLGWLHPVTILGIALGTVIFVLVGAVLTGQAGLLVWLGASFPHGLATWSPDRVAFVLVAILMAAKWLVAVLLLRAPAAPGA
jgi:hypothetical protein